MQPRRPPRRLRTLSRVLAVLAGAWLAIEAFSCGAVCVATGRIWPWPALAAERAALAEGVEAGQNAPLDAPEFDVVHPYLGFVMNRERSSPELLLRFGFPISEYGFLDGWPPIREASPERLIVGIFGGSLAQELSRTAWEALTEGLEQIPAFQGRQVVLVRAALGGYKQPQQLIALSYLLALGAHFDLVINLDGFNEAALSAVENIPHGVFPFFPRAWHRRVDQLPDHATLSSMGRIALLRERRIRWARLAGTAPLRFSPTATLLWWRLDRLLQGRTDAEQSRLAEPDAAPEPFAARGPAFAYTDPDDLYRKLARVWSQSSLQMQRLCQANGIGYFHFLQPNQYVPGSKPMGQAERERVWRQDYRFREPIERGYPTFREEGRALRAAGVPFHDLVMLFAGHEEPLYRDVCCHLSEPGYALLASEIARQIAESDPDSWGRAASR